MMGLAIAGMGTAALLTFKKMVDKYVEVGDAIDKMSKRTGFSAEALSELAYAADISGTNLDTLEKGVKKMAKTIVEADEGMATYVRAFDRIGLSAEELIDLSPEKQFDRITMAIAELESPTLRAAAAQEIFGRAGTELLPLMAEGAEGMKKLRKEAHRLGYVFDEETAAKAAKLKDAQTDLKKAFEGVSFAIVSETIPVLTILTKKFSDVFAGIREEGRTVSSMITGFFDIIVKATGGVLIAFKALYISMLKLNKTMAESLMITLEEIEYAVVMSKNFLLMAKLLPPIANALARLNEIRSLDIDLIEKEEGALVNLMGFFTDLQREIAATGSAYGKMAGIVVTQALPASRNLADVYGMMVGHGRDMTGVLEAALPVMESQAFMHGVVAGAAKKRTEAEMGMFEKIGTAMTIALGQSKAGAIAQAIMSTYAGAAKTIAMLGMPWAIPFVAMAIIQGMKQVAAIQAQSIPSMAEGGIVEREGPHYLHAGEEVRPVEEVRGAPGAPTHGPFHITVYQSIYAQRLDDRTINQAAEKIRHAVNRQERRY